MTRNPDIDHGNYLAPTFYYLLPVDRIVLSTVPGKDSNTFAGGGSQGLVTNAYPPKSDVIDAIRHIATATATDRDLV